jgi:hypothetical protein
VTIYQFTLSSIAESLDLLCRVYFENLSLLLEFHERGQELLTPALFCDVTLLIFGRTALRFTRRKKDVLTITVVKLSRPLNAGIVQSSSRLCDCEH